VRRAAGATKATSATRPPTKGFVLGSFAREYEQLRSDAAAAAPVPVDYLTADARSSAFSAEVVLLLRQWMVAHWNDPYPSEEEKRRLCALAGLT